MHYINGSLLRMPGVNTMDSVREKQSCSVIIPYIRGPVLLHCSIVYGSD